MMSSSSSWRIWIPSNCAHGSAMVWDIAVGMDQAPLSIIAATLALRCSVESYLVKRFNQNSSWMPWIFPKQGIFSIPNSIKHVLLSLLSGFEDLTPSPRTVLGHSHCPETLVLNEVYTQATHKESFLEAMAHVWRIMAALFHTSKLLMPKPPSSLGKQNFIHLIGGRFLRRSGPPQRN